MSTVADFGDFTERRKHLTLTEEPHRWIENKQPFEDYVRKDQEQPVRNTDIVSRNPQKIRPLYLCADFGAAVVEPKLEKIFLVQTMLCHFVIDHSAGFPSYALPSSHQSASELRVLVADLTTRNRAQVGAKATVLLKHRALKSHVSTVGSPVDLSGLIAEVKKGKNPTQRERALECQPTGR